MYAHNYAVDIEIVLRKVFNCERGGFAGVIDADFIETHCYAAITAAMGYLFAISDEAKKKSIEQFLCDFGYYLNFGIKGLLEFTTNERNIDGTTTTMSIDYNNGEEALEACLSALTDVCN